MPSPEEDREHKDRFKLCELEGLQGVLGKWLALSCPDPSSSGNYDLTRVELTSLFLR